MFKESNLKDWLELCASIGIILGLILVGFQMQQNTRLLRTQLLFEEGISYAESEEVFLGENPAAVWAKAIESPTELNLEEQRIIEAYYWSSVKRWETLFDLAAQGLIENEWRARVSEEAPYVFGNSYGRAWWTNYSLTEPDNELVRLINRGLERTPDFTTDYHQNTIGILNEALNQ